MKHRLVGTAVLVALGIIIWPVLFDTTPVREISQRSKIPDAPPVERFAIDEPEAPQLPPQPDYTAERAASAVAGETPVPDATSSTTPVAQPPEPQPPKPQARPVQPQKQATEPAPALLDQHGLPVQWAVQLGVFGKLENAQEIKRRAEKSGYHAILQTVSNGGVTQYRVYVDPKLDKQAAQKLAAEVEKNLALKGFVTRYYP